MVRSGRVAPRPGRAMKGNMGWAVPAGMWAGDAAFILGGGPSLAGVDVERLRGRGRVIAVNDAGLDLAPWADMLYFSDGWERWFGWNERRLSEFHGEWIVSRTAVADARVKRLVHKPRLALSRDPRFVAGYCSGASAINIAYLAGARVIVLLGFDMRELRNWHANHKSPNPDPNAARTKFIPALERMAPELAADGCLVLNTNPRSALRCFPFADLEDLLAMDDIAAAEAEKYRRIWERPEYRHFSPGEMEVERAFAVCEMQAGERLTDFGAGTARATAWFAGRGLGVLAVDHVETARETDVPFQRACLWDMEEAQVPVADIGYCCDVMEHIPPEKVGDVLRQIRSLTRRGCYFRIATRPDVAGKLIGETLHLTVEGGEWWRRRVEAHWDLVDVVNIAARDVVLWARP